MDNGRLEDYFLPVESQVVILSCRRAFEALNAREKLYAHHLSKASWNGGLIVLLQTSPESAYIFCLLHKILCCESIQSLRKRNSNMSYEEFRAFLVYTCGIFSNMGNHKSFGDTKFIPNVPPQKMEHLVLSSAASQANPDWISSLWNKCKDRMYSLLPTHRALGFPDKGVTTYFSSNCDSTDSALVNEYFKLNKVEGYNSRILKTVNDGQATYEIRFASTKDGFDSTFMLPPTEFNGCKFITTRYDYSSLLEPVVLHLSKSLEFAANPVQASMIEKYIESFTTGKLSEHKNGSRLWITDKNPIIETYIGFIETYRDPGGIRGEFEGFVAMVNKQMSLKFAALVVAASDLISKLPWGRSYEKDEFLQPDFTSLDVLTFAGSGIPAGINIPNYDDIRQEEGFKNVSLGNVIPATFKTNDFFFLAEEDRALMSHLAIKSFEVQVGLHELLGHGSGKLLRCLEDKSYNFDRQNVIDPLTGLPVSSWYMEGETYDSVFTDISSSYEECRAECVGLYLSMDPEVLRIFGHEGVEAENITYINWLNLLWAGTGKALEMYNPETGNWLQAHSQARFVIVQVILEAGQGLYEVVETQPDFELMCALDKTKIATVGKRAIEDFLLKLQLYKSTRNYTEARKMYNRYSQVNDDGVYPWARWRTIVMKHKRPRKMFVQCNTVIKDGDVNLDEYEQSYDGLVQSWIERFDNNDQIYSSLIQLADKDFHHFAKGDISNT